MPTRRASSRLLLALAAALLAASALAPAPARAQTPLLSEVQTIAAPTTGVPIEHSFTIPAAGSYTITLTDLGASLSPPAPLASVKLAVTGSTNTIVGTPLAAAGTLTLSDIAAGTYELHVVGMPGNVPGSGPIGIVIAGGSMTPITYQDIVALPSQALPNGEAVLDDTFTVPTSGTYTVSLNDLQLPQALTQLTLIIVAGGTPVLTLPTSGNAYTSSVALSAGVTYSIFAVGEANASANAGLYSAVVTGSGGAVAYGRAVPVGSTMHLGSPGLAAGTYSLVVGDLAFPNALTQLGAALLLNGTATAQLSAAGSASFTAVAGTYEAYAAATAAAAAPGAGSYALQIKPQGGGAAVFAVGRGVTVSGSALAAYAFDTTLAAAGAEMVSLTDFQFPAALTSVSIGAEQGGALLGTPLKAAGTLSISAASGPLSLVVFAQPGSGSTGGVFGIDVAPGATATPVYEVTQAVGALFSVQQVTIPAAGAYSVTATDLAWPASFASYDTIVTAGTTQVGSIYGGGTFNFTATPGTYFVNFIAQPTGSDEAGTYALTVANAPAGPVISLSVDNAQVSSGSTVDIVWSSQNATSCTASGGWTGTQALSGTATSATLTSNTTFTLSCTGAGGTTSKSVTVTVTAAGSGGGGEVSPELLMLLLGLMLLRAVPDLKVRARKPVDRGPPRTPR